jgi:hypothetical protein
MKDAMGPQRPQRPLIRSTFWPFGQRQLGTWMCTPNSPRSRDSYRSSERSSYCRWASTQGQPHSSTATHMTTMPLNLKRVSHETRTSPADSHSHSLHHHRHHGPSEVWTRVDEVDPARREVLMLWTGKSRPWCGRTSTDPSQFGSSSPPARFQ